MARQVLPIVGAIVGGFFGAPQLGFAIGSIIGNAVDPQVIQGPKIGEAGIQTSAEGVYRPIVRGTAPVMGNVIARGNRVIRKDRQSAGKGGGPVTEAERVFWTFAIRLGEPITAVTRIWQDEKLVFDILPTSQIVEESEDFAQKFRLYLGTEDQLPDPDLEVIYGVDNTPSYPGTAYVVFPNFDLTDYRERIPTFRFECSGTAELLADVLAVRGGSVNGSMASLNGETWPGWNTGVNVVLGNLISMGSRFASHTGANGAVRYTDDLGQTWHSSAGAPLSPWGGTLVLAYDQDTNLLLIPGGGAEMRRSRDRGETLEIVEGSPPANAIANVGGTWVAVQVDGVNTPIHVSSEGSSWGTAPEPAPRLSSAAVVIAASPTGAIFGSQIDSLPALFRFSPNGGTWVELDMPPFLSATAVTAIEYGEIGEDEIWVIGTDSGEFARSTDGGATWSVSPDGFGGQVRQIAFTGIGFVAIGGDGGLGDSGFIVSSEDGRDWVTRYTAPTLSGEVWTSIGSSIPTVAFGSLTVGAIVSEMHQRAGHTSSDYDVSELTQEIYGIVFAEGYNCGDAIRTLMSMYFFDASEHDAGTGYRINYSVRGKPVVLTITDDDIIQAPERTVREDSLERPRKLHLHYQNPTIGYAPAKATVARDSPDIRVVGERSLQVPVVFSDVAEPRQIAHKLLKIAWVEVAGEEEFVLPDSFLELVTGDAIGVSLRGQTRRLRIDQESIGLGSQSYVLKADRQSAYASSITGVPVPPPTPPLPSIVGQTIAELMDIPALVDTNDRLLYYRAMTGQTDAWFGAQGQIKPEGATDFFDDIRFTDNTVMGVLLEPIAAASEHYPDTTNIVRVELYSDDVIEAITDTQFLSEGGSFALKNSDGTWEILQYRDVDDEGDRVFALSHLARGRLNSGATEHDEGARFVLLSGVRSVDTGSSLIGTNIEHRAISFGMSADGTPSFTTEFNGKSQREFPVANVLLSRAGDTVNVRVVPRHRFGTETNPVRSVNWTGFRVTASDGANSATVDTVNDVVDFDATGWSSPITVTAAQLNRFTGPGPTVSEQIA